GTSSSISGAPPRAPTTRSTTCRPGWPPRRSWRGGGPGAAAGAAPAPGGRRLAAQSRPGAARVWRRDGSRTESPNAGQTMAAMAGALGVTLEKRGHYRLGGGPPPAPDAIDRALRVARGAAALGLAGAGLTLLVAGLTLRVAGLTLRV